MNAYKLADALQETEPYYLADDKLFDKAANMLRQQADRIAELESCLEFAYKDTMDYYKLNNLGGENNHWLVWARKLLNIEYTTPQTKPLSDEEILGLVKNHFIGAMKLGIVLTNNNVLEFAKAIEERHGIK